MNEELMRRESLCEWIDNLTTEDMIKLLFELDSKNELLTDELNQEKEKNKKLEEVINNLAKGVKYLGTNEELTTEDIIKIFSPVEIKIDFDDFMKRWENEQHKKADLKDKVINMIAEDVCKDDGTLIMPYTKESVKEYYFRKARGEEDVKD